MGALLMAALLALGCSQGCQALRSEQLRRAGASPAQQPPPQQAPPDAAAKAAASSGVPPAKVRLFCFMVVRPSTVEVELMRLHLSSPMLSGCNGYKVYSNASMVNLFAPDEGARRHVIAGAVSGSMESPIEGWPPEKPVIYSAANTAVFLQAWHHVLQSRAHEKFDWIVKVDPDTVFFPDRLRLLLRGRSPDEAYGLFDGGELCQSGMGGIGVLSRAAVKMLAEKEELLPLMHVNKEDGLLKGALNAWALGWRPEPNLLLNPVPRLDCASAPWKAAYHPFKDPALLAMCLRSAADRAQPGPNELHQKCL